MPASETPDRPAATETPTPPADQAPKDVQPVDSPVASIPLDLSPPRLGETMLYFESSTADDRMVGRPCRLVENVGEGRYDVDVDYFRTDTAAGKPDTARLRDVPFFEGHTLPRDKTNRFWLWPRGKNFIARTTPELGPMQTVPTPPAGRLTHSGQPSQRPAPDAPPAPRAPAERSSGGTFIPKPERRAPRESNATGLVRPKEGAKFDE